MNEFPRRRDVATATTADNLNKMTPRQLLDALDVAEKGYDNARRVEIEEHVGSLMQQEAAREAEESKEFFGSYLTDIERPSEKAEDPEAEVRERRAGIKQLAAITFGLPESASWADLAKKGGYDAYLKKVESLCKYGERLVEDEVSVGEWAEAKENNVALTRVSGLTIFKKRNLRSVKSPAIPVVDKVLLSVTNKKKWSHQPFGGKRNKGEGAVAAMLREFGEETDWDSAVQLLRDFKSGKAFYLGCYVQQFPDKKGGLFIQSFAMHDAKFDAGKLGSGSDSSGFLWAGSKELEGENGQKISLTEQAEKNIKSAFGFIGRQGGALAHPDPEYTGRPDLEWRRNRKNAEKKSFEQPHTIDGASDKEHSGSIATRGGTEDALKAQEPRKTSGLVGRLERASSDLPAQSTSIRLKDGSRVEIEHIADRAWKFNIPNHAAQVSRGGAQSFDYTVGDMRTAEEAVRYLNDQLLNNEYKMSERAIVKAAHRLAEEESVESFVSRGFERTGMLREAMGDDETPADIAMQVAALTDQLHAIKSPREYSFEWGNDMKKTAESFAAAVEEGSKDAERELERLREALTINYLFEVEHEGANGRRPAEHDDSHSSVTTEKEQRDIEQKLSGLVNRLIRGFATELKLGSTEGNADAVIVRAALALKRSVRIDQFNDKDFSTAVRAFRMLDMTSAVNSLSSSKAARGNLKEEWRRFKPELEALVEKIEQARRINAIEGGASRQN